MTTHLRLVEGAGPPDVDAVGEAISERVMLTIWRSGLTQSAVAELIGISPGMLSARLRGRSDFLTGELYRLSCLLDVRLEWLFLEGPLEQSTR